MTGEELGCDAAPKATGWATKFAGYGKLRNAARRHMLK